RRDLLLRPALEIIEPSRTRGEIQTALTRRIRTVCHCGHATPLSSCLPAVVSLKLQQPSNITTDDLRVAVRIGSGTLHLLELELIVDERRVGSPDHLVRANPLYRRLDLEDRGARGLKIQVLELTGKLDGLLDGPEE